MVKSRRASLCPRRSCLPTSSSPADSRGKAWDRATSNGSSRGRSTWRYQGAASPRNQGHSLSRVTTGSHAAREHCSEHGVMFPNVSVDALAHRSQGQRADATRRGRRERSLVRRFHCDPRPFLRSFTAGESGHPSATSLLRARDDECLSPARLLECQGQPAPVYARRPGVQRNFRWRAKESARARVAFYDGPPRRF